MAPEDDDFNLDDLDFDDDDGGDAGGDDFSLDDLDPEADAGGPTQTTQTAEAPKAEEAPKPEDTPAGEAPSDEEQAEDKPWKPLVDKAQAFLKQFDISDANLQVILLETIGVFILATLSIYVTLKIISPTIDPKSFQKKQIEKALQAKKKAKMQKKQQSSTTFFEVPPVVINLSGSQGHRFLRISLSLQLSAPGKIAKYEKSLAKINDLLIYLLGGKSYEDIDEVRDKYILRREIVSTLNQMAGEDEVLNVYFKEFVIQ